MAEKKPLNLSLPIELIQDVKVACIRQGLTVSDVVEALLWDYLHDFNLNSHSEEDENEIDS